MIPPAQSPISHHWALAWAASLLRVPSAASVPHCFVLVCIWILETFSDLTWQGRQDLSIEAESSPPQGT